MKIDQLLESIGLTEYQSKFDAHAISDDLVFSLTSDDLREIGVVALGHRKRILAAIAEQVKGEKTRATPAAVNEVQRRQVTVLFADLVDSTRLSRILDAEDLRDLIRAYHAVARDAIERFGGYVAQYLGDGVLAYFGFPRSHEDDAERSVRAALDLIAGLSDVQLRVGARLGVTVEARVGIETGPVIVGGEADHDNAAIGETLNLAARLQSVAAPGMVVIGKKTKSLLGDNAQLSSHGSHQLKGFRNAVETWQVNGLGFGVDRFASNEGRSRSTFVGRTKELHEIEDSLAQVRAGETACVHVVGEPGIGKSRLIHEFLTRAPRTTRVLPGHCAPFGAAALHPFAAMLARRARTRADLFGGSRRNALSSEISEIDRGLTSDIPYLLRLAGLLDDDETLDPDTVGTRTQKALVRLIGAIGRVLPTVLFMNDIHWIDERSESVVSDVVKSELRGVLVVCIFRPEYVPPWAELAAVRRVDLGPLDAGTSEALYRSCVGSKTGNVTDVVERSGGNPLFIEELAAHTEVASAQGDAGEGRVNLTPSNLSGLLLQRVDSLSPKSKSFLRTASVIGRRFPAKLVMREGPERDLALTELKKAALLIEDSALDQLRFKHALVQDAIYEGLLSADRRSIHAKIAHRLEDLFAGSEEDVAEDLARHFEIADEPISAARYCFIAGEKALELFALRDAARWFDRCLLLFPKELNSEDERLRAAAVMNQIQVSCWDARFGEMLALGNRELDRMRGLGEDNEVSRMLSWMGEAFLHDWRYDDAQAVLNEALEIGEKINNAQCIGYALAELAWLHSIIGMPDDRDEFDALTARLFGLARELGDRLLTTFGRYAQWASACHDGRLANARAAAGDLLTYGNETGYPPAHAWGHCMAAYIEALSGNVNEALHHCDLAGQMAGCAFDRLAVDLCRGVSLQECGQASEALDEFEKAGRRVHSVGSFFFGYASIVSKGRALAALGQIEESKKVLSEAAERFQNAGHHRASAMAKIALGEILSGDAETTVQAEETLKSAIDIAVRMGMSGLGARGIATRGLLARAAGQEKVSQSFFNEAKKMAAPLGWLALEQHVNAAAAGLQNLHAE